MFGTVVDTRVCGMKDDPRPTERPGYLHSCLEYAKRCLYDADSAANSTRGQEDTDGTKKLVERVLEKLQVQHGQISAEEDIASMLRHLHYPFDISRSGGLSHESSMSEPVLLALRWLVHLCEYGTEVTGQVTTYHEIFLKLFKTDQGGPLTHNSFSYRCLSSYKVAVKSMCSYLLY